MIGDFSFFEIMRIMDQLSIPMFNKYAGLSCEDIVGRFEWK